MKRALLLLLSPLAFSLAAPPARADLIYASQTTGSGVYKYDTVAGGASTLAFSTQGGFAANDLGVNTAGTRFYYSDGSGTSGGLYVYNATTGVQTEFASTGNSATNLASGGTFFNGTYYAGILDPLLPYISTYTFAADGVTLLSTGQITPSNFGNLGDFGDFAINPLTGTLYGESQNFNGSGQNVFFSLDPTLSNPFVTVINNTEPGVFQLAFDSQGNLFATNNANASLLYQVNLSTGALNSGFSNPFGFQAFDMAGYSLPPSVVPEPASLAMMAVGLATAGAVAMRRRTRSKAGSSLGSRAS